MTQHRRPLFVKYLERDNGFGVGLVYDVQSGQSAIHGQFFNGNQQIFDQYAAKCLTLRNLSLRSLSG